MYKFLYALVDIYGTVKNKVGFSKLWFLGESDQL